MIVWEVMVAQMLYRPPAEIECNTCKRILAASMFNGRKQCKSCIDIYRKSHRERNKKRVKARRAVL